MSDARLPDADGDADALRGTPAGRVDPEVTLIVYLDGTTEQVTLRPGEGHTAEGYEGYLTIHCDAIEDPGIQEVDE